MPSKVTLLSTKCYLIPKKNGSRMPFKIFKRFTIQAAIEIENYTSYKPTAINCSNQNFSAKNSSMIKEVTGITLTN